MIDAIKIVRGSAWRVVHFDNDWQTLACDMLAN